MAQYNFLCGLQGHHYKFIHYIGVDFTDKGSVADAYECCFRCGHKERKRILGVKTSHQFPAKDQPIEDLSIHINLSA